MNFSKKLLVTLVAHLCLAAFYVLYFLIFDSSSFVWLLGIIPSIVAAYIWDTKDLQGVKVKIWKDIGLSLWVILNLLFSLAYLFALDHWLGAL